MFLCIFLFYSSPNHGFKSFPKDVYLLPGGFNIEMGEKILDDDKGTRALDSLMYYAYEADTGEHLTWTGISDSAADTFMVWFDPTAIIPWEFPCSLRMFRVYLSNYHDSLNNHEAAVFVAKLHQNIDYYQDYNQAQWLQTPADDTVGPPPIKEIVYEKVYSFPAAPDSFCKFHVKEILSTPIDMGREIFGIGWHKNDAPGTDSVAPNPVIWFDFNGNAGLPTHSLVHGSADVNEGWFSYFENFYGSPFCILAKVRYYMPQGLEEEDNIDEIKLYSVEIFKKEADIQFFLSERAHVNLSIHDCSGRLIKVLVDEEMDRGNHITKWNGKDLWNRRVPNGIYFCHLRACGRTLTEKIILLK